MSEEHCACGAVAVWHYMPDDRDEAGQPVIQERAYCEEHVPSRGCSCMGDDPELDDEGRPPPCCELAKVLDVAGFQS